MVKKAPKKDRNKFSVFYNLFHIFPLLLRKKTKPLTFSALFVTGNRKTARKRPIKNFSFFFFFFFLLFCILPLPLKIFLFFFFFFFTFLHPTAPRNQKNCHLPFFLKFRLKVPKTAAKRDQVSFFTNYLFSAVITRTHTPTHTHTPSFLTTMLKKR